MPEKIHPPATPRYVENYNKWAREKYPLGSAVWKNRKRIMFGQVDGYVSHDRTDGKYTHVYVSGVQHPDGTNARFPEQRWPIVKIVRKDPI